MATGDLRGNLERLRTQLLSVNYPHPFDVQGLKQGIPAVVLPLLHYALLGYSRHVARYLSANGYELYAKSDLRFMESALKFFRHEFNYRCALTIAQMFSRGYAERKMIFIYDAVQMTKRKHNELLKLGREKTIDKTELTQINYETMPGCGLGNAKVQAVDRLPFYEPKPWEHTLRSSKNPVRCSKDAECQLVDITVLPVPEPTSPRAPNSDSNVVHNQHGLCTEDSDKKSWELASRMRAKKLQPKAKKFVMSLQNSAEVPHPAASELSEGESEICQRIMDMADKLEARFSTLEDGVTRAKETLQEKLVGLEGRVQSLESVVSSKKQNQKLVHRSDFRDLSRNDFKQHTAACTTGEPSQRESLIFGSPCTTKDPRQHDNYDHLSTCTSVESIRPKCNERAWSLSEKFQDSPRDACTGVPASKAIKSQAVRDISNTHQCVANTYGNIVGTSDVKLGEKGHTSLIQPGPVTSTREFIAGVRARFSRTLELLNKEAHIPNTAASSC